jgi:hypothetical protein
MAWRTTEFLGHRIDLALGVLGEPSGGGVGRADEVAEPADLGANVVDGPDGPDLGHDGGRRVDPKRSWSGWLRPGSVDR